MVGPKYPKSMYRVVDDGIDAVVVPDEQRELALAEQGWSPRVPRLPQAPAVQTDDTAAAIGGLAKALAELGARVEKLEQQKRGPGRPPREDK